MITYFFLEQVNLLSALLPVLGSVPLSELSSWLPEDNFPFYLFIFTIVKGICKVVAAFFSRVQEKYTNLSRFYCVYVGIITSVGEDMYVCTYVRQIPRSLSVLLRVLRNKNVSFHGRFPTYSLRTF